MKPYLKSWIRVPSQQNDVNPSRLELRKTIDQLAELIQSGTKNSDPRLQTLRKKYIELTKKPS